MLGTAEKQGARKDDQAQQRAADSKTTGCESRPERSQQEPSLLPAMDEAAHRLSGVAVRERNIEFDYPSTGAARVNAERDRKSKVRARIH
jgi:hypothetical protein